MQGMSTRKRSQSRASSGVPSGGQFTTGRRGETGDSTLRAAAAHPAPPKMHAIAGGEEAGLAWALTRGPSGTTNGYVRLPENHPWAGRDAFEITEADNSPAYITYARDGWVGFDSAGGEEAARTQAHRLAHVVREAHLRSSLPHTCLA
jgi:hypothetical protein